MASTVPTRAKRFQAALALDPPGFKGPSDPSEFADIDRHNCERSLLEGDLWGGTRV